MPRVLSAGSYTITSLSEGTYLGVNRTKPGSQFVYLDAPVFKWDIEIVNDKLYRLKVDGYSYTGGSDGYVNATVSAVGSQDWLLTWSEYAQAHVIQNPTDLKGWTANPVSPSDDSQKQIQLTEVRSTRSQPPQYAPNQLFRLDSIGG